MAYSTIHHDLAARPPMGAGPALASRPPADPSSSGDGGSRFAHYIKQPLERAFPIAFGVGTAVAIATGFALRGEQHLTPEEGTGYWLGIAGATMMLMLLLYPLRKRLKILRAAGSVGAWFRMHMLLGILGPTLILFHANFQLSSANATAATLAMLTVVASGVVGRYLYSRVHFGLYGREAEADELIEDIALLEEALSESADEDRQFASALKELQRLLPPADAGALSSLSAMMRLRLHSGGVIRTLSKRADRVITAKARAEHWTRARRREVLAEITSLLRLFSLALQKAAALAFYSRLFALWHMMHLPLFFLLIVTALTHIVAVHLY